MTHLRAWGMLAAGGGACCGARCQRACRSLGSKLTVAAGQTSLAKVKDAAIPDQAYLPATNALTAEGTASVMAQRGGDDGPFIP